MDWIFCKPSRSFFLFDFGLTSGVVSDLLLKANFLRISSRVLVENSVVVLEDGTSTFGLELDSMTRMNFSTTVESASEKSSYSSPSSIISSAIERIKNILI